MMGRTPTPVDPNAANTPEVNPAVQQLNALLTLNTKSVEGYDKAAADLVDNPGLEDIFADFAQIHTTYVEALTAEINAVDGVPDGSVTYAVIADLHQIWLDIRAGLTDGDEQAVLAEVQRGLETTVSAYEQALTLPRIEERTRRLLNSQYKGVQSMLERITELEDAYDAG